MINLSDKTAIITGGASGIGRAICEIFAELGAYVYALDLDLDAAEKLAKSIRKKGNNATALLADVTSYGDIRRIINKINDQRPINILINNAGIAHVGNVENTRIEDMDRLYEVNIKGVFNCTKACISHLKNNGGGAILNIASVAASVGIEDRFAYSMTKGAVLAMTYSVAKDYLKEEIRCNSISPGRIHTPFVDNFLRKNYPGKEQEMFVKLSKTQPIGRMGTPREVAELAAFLGSDSAKFITGSDYPVDGGFIKLNG